MLVPETNCLRNYWRSCWWPQQPVQEMTERLLLQNKPTPAPAHPVSLAGTGRRKPLGNQFGYSQHSSGQTFSITTLVTVKLSFTCTSQKQFNPFSTDFFFQGKKSEWKANRSLLGACQLAHMLLMVCKDFSSKRVLRNAFWSVLWRHPGTPEAARSSGWEEALANFWYWAKIPWTNIHRLSCFLLLLADSALSASLAEIFPSLLVLDSQIC